MSEYQTSERHACRLLGLATIDAAVSGAESGKRRRTAYPNRIRFPAKSFKHARWQKELATQRQRLPVKANCWPTSVDFKAPRVHILGEDVCFLLHVENLRTSTGFWAAFAAAQKSS